MYGTSLLRRWLLVCITNLVVVTTGLSGSFTLTLINGGNQTQSAVFHSGGVGWTPCAGGHGAVFTASNMGVGETRQWTINVTDPLTYRFWVECPSGGSGNPCQGRDAWTPPQTWYSNAAPSSMTFYIYPGVNCALIPWKIIRCVYNSNPYPTTYTMFTNDVEYVTSAAIPPGATWCATATMFTKGTVKIAATFNYYNQDGTLAGKKIYMADSIDANHSDWVQGTPTTPAATPDTGIRLDQDSVSQNGTNIVFGTGSTAATDETLKTGFRALQKADTEGLGRIEQAILGSEGKQTSLENSLNTGFANVNGNLVNIKTATDLVASTLNTNITALKTNVAGSNTRLDTLATKLTSIDTTDALILTNNLLAYTNGLDRSRSLTNINSNVVAVVAVGTNILNAGLAGNYQLTNISGKMDTEIAKLDLVLADTTPIKNNTATANTTLNTINTSVGTVTTAVGTVDSRVNTAISRIETGNTLIGNVESAVTALRSDLTSRYPYQQGKLDEIKDAINTAASALGVKTDNTTNYIGAVASRVDATTNHLGAIANHIDAATNFLGQALARLGATNTAPDVNTNLQWNAGVAAASGIKGDFDDFTNSIAIPTSPTTSAITTTVSFGTFGTIDFNPMHNASVAILAAFCRAGLSWCIVFIYICGCWKATEAYLVASPAARQASSAGTTILGNNANTGIALGMAALMTVAIAAVPSFAFTLLSPQLSAIATGPFQSASPIVQASVWLADQFIPLASLVAHAVLLLIFRAQVAGVYWVATTLVRFLVG